MGTQTGDYINDWEAQDWELLLYATDEKQMSGIWCESHEG